MMKGTKLLGTKLHMVYILATVLTLVATLILYFYIVGVPSEIGSHQPQKRRVTLEPFTDDISQNKNHNDPVNLDRPTSTLFRDKNAIQSCEMLRTDDPAMSGKSQDTMRLVLDSHRINEWKPGPDEAQDMKTAPDKAYCYMYNDKKNNMKDIRLFDDTGCSMENPIFKGTPFINRVYGSKKSDNTHTIPIEKCVIEIDPSLITTPHLDDYWKRWGDTMCDSVTDPLRVAVQDSDKAIEALENKITEIKELIELYNVRLDQTILDIKSCEITKEENEQVLKDLISQYNDIYDAFKIVEAQRNEAIILKSDKLEEEKEQLQGVEEERSLFVEFSEKNNTCQIELQKCNRAREDVEEALRIQLVTQAENEDVRAERIDELNTIEGEYNDLIRPVAECDSELEDGRRRLDETIENIDRTRGLYNTCEVEKAYNKARMEIFEPKFERMKERAEECLKKKEQLFRDNEICAEQKKTCNFLKDEHANTLKRFREIRDKLLIVQERGREYNTIRKGLEEQNVFHYNELEQKSAQLDEFENTLYKEEIRSSISNSEAIIDKYRSDLDKLTDVHIQSSGCVAKADYVRDLNKRKNHNAELKYRVDVLRSQSCYYCDPTITHCAEKFKNDKTLCKR